MRAPGVAFVTFAARAVSAVLTPTTMDAALDAGADGRRRRRQDGLDASTPATGFDEDDGADGRDAGAANCRTPWQGVVLVALLLGRTEFRLGRSVAVEARDEARVVRALQHRDQVEREVREE